jgi:phosphoribosyl-ATP pyrophosphohydrolase/phosphoribosyl-AMP cyclohydrolase
MIIPSIDIMNGKAVQLRQGKEKILEKEDVLELAKEFFKYGEIAVIDLDAALGKGNNTQLIKQICKIAECRVGGGIRSIEKAKEYLRAGAKKIIIGTKADKEFLKKLPKDNIIIAVDTKDGFVAKKGWTESTETKPEDLISELEDYCSEFLFTNINKEGMMKGFDYNIVSELKKLTSNKITAAGGITNIKDIEQLESIDVNSQIGMAIYTGTIDLKDAFVSVLKLTDGLIPTIVQDNRGQVLMLAYSNKDSILKSYETGKATYYSRSRKGSWTKGETSGNYQEFVKARYDCDRDTVLFTVKQTNAACHTNMYSCFQDKQFRLTDLYELLSERTRNLKNGSYTSKLAIDTDYLKEKICEEAREVVEYTDRSNLIWEIADLTYFVLVLMATQGITISEIRNELRSRRK